MMIQLFSVFQKQLVAIKSPKPAVARRAIDRDLSFETLVRVRQQAYSKMA